MTNQLTTRSVYHPSLLTRNVFDTVFDSFFNDIPQYLQKSTQGYPVADIYRDEDGSTVLEFALAGFKKEELTVNVEADKRSITVAAKTSGESEDTNRRIARRSFQKTYVNYDNNLDLNSTSANFENGLLTICVPRRPEIEPLSIEIS